MSRRLMAFLLQELNMVRLICKSPACGAVTEMTVEQMSSRMAIPKCPVCASEFLGEGNVGPNTHLAVLAKTIRSLQHFDKSVGIEFIIPDNENKTL